MTVRARRALALLALLAGLLTGIALPCMATEFHVRMDGGTPAQCTGRVDAAYPGHGRAQPCAWQHPFDALPPGGTPRIAGGDTLLIGPGDYRIGFGAPGSDDAGSSCASDWRWDCHPAAVPSGPGAQQRTRILGAGFDSGCKAPPTLWGSERANTVLDLRGSSHVEVACLDITDRSDCIESHVDPAVRCQRDVAPHGDWASVGILASASRDVLLRDLDIHGLAHTGIQAGGLRDWTLERVRINGNGWVGWDGDIGPASSNAGAMVFRDVEIAWNGCAERWATPKLHHGCWAQESGGYGDGLGTAATGGHWLFEQLRVHHNTSDGLDLLYLDGGPDSSATLRRVLAADNAGNQVKLRGTARVENSVINGSCAWFRGRDAMTAGDLCRAQGNAVSLALVAGREATLAFNTITGQGDCLVLSEGGDATSRLLLEGNALVGQQEFGDDAGGLVCGHYAHRSPARVSFSGNAFWNVKSGQCPAGSLCGRNPKLANMGLAAFDPDPLPGSPLIDAAPGNVRIQNDFHGRPRPSGRAPDIGAVEFQGR